jgi:DNA-binding NarL/FixJ family response regulator
MAANRSGLPILISTANAMTGELLAGAFNRQPGFRVVAIATTAQEVFDAVSKLDLEVALINATLADGLLSGFRALRQVRDCSPHVKSIALLENHDRNLVVDAFRAGAKGVFCPSRSSFKELCRCVDRVHAGQIWASSAELSDVMDAFFQLAPVRVVNANGLRLLTKREDEVVTLLAGGLANREIAREMNLSEHTIKNYLFRIFDKLGVSSRVELVLYAVSNSKRLQDFGGAANEKEFEIDEMMTKGADLLLARGDWGS